MMRKVILGVIWILYCYGGEALAAASAGVIIAEVRTNATVLIKTTTLPTECDTVYVCYIPIGSTDTTFVASDSTYAIELLSGLTPSLYAAFFKVVRDEGKTAVSAKDTVRVYSPERESGAADRELNYTERVIRALSWRPTSVIETLTVDGMVGADSSGHYEPWNHNSITVEATQAGDSVKVMLYTWYGHRDMKIQKGITTGFVPSADSLNITGPGIFGKTLTLNMAAPVMYFKLQSYVANGQNTAINIWLTRDRH